VRLGAKQQIFGIRGDRDLYGRAEIEQDGGRLRDGDEVEDGMGTKCVDCASCNFKRFITGTEHAVMYL
jgi:hypothetical protein